MIDQIVYYFETFAELSLTHHLASNIIYHIGKSGVSVDGNILKLLGDEKRYYFDYFGCNDVIQKIIL